ncbi:dihydrolipoamide acetyltransferase family protein [Janibacter sp. GXQ6167]|uniref:dihydrolipoamide acetyltransferase family protein n=1 Tax=Janibacter sp. GXQ6167 TaxID=3240791 RepID=UPI003523D166
MALKPFNLPDPGEGLVEADLVTWRVAVGDTVTVNQIVVEVETAKSLVELPIPFAGRVAELLAAEGDTVDVGAPIIVIETDEPATSEPASDGGGDGDEEPLPTLVGYGAKASSGRRRARRSPAAAAPPSSGSAPAAPEAPAEQPAPAVQDEGSEPAAPMTGERARALAKPPVRKLAKDLGVDLVAISGSGPGGIVTRGDVEAAASSAPSSSAHARASAESGGQERPAETRVPIKGVRKATAQAMVDSAFTAPHVTEFVTVDVTSMIDMVSALKSDREFAGAKVTPLLLVAKALCLAVRRHPDVNASWDEAAQEIVIKRDVNLGIAAATPRGLMVPNIKAADRMSVRELADALSDLVTTAKEGKTQPADLSGGTITITNVGVFGVDAGTPILNPGEAAILAFGAVRRMPWVVTAADGTESIEPRWVTQLALSFDHRMIDGELGSLLLADIAALLHDPGRAFLW